MKSLIVYLYRKCVNEIYIPTYQTFSIGLGGCKRANAEHWNSFLPDTLTLHIKTINGCWKYYTFSKKYGRTSYETQ